MGDAVQGSGAGRDARPAPLHCKGTLIQEFPLLANIPAPPLRTLLRPTAVLALVCGVASGRTAYGRWPTTTVASSSSDRTMRGASPPLTMAAAVPPAWRLLVSMSK